ncbi:type II toxin-antitoxin system PemK/MazF family toxin [Arthrobacter sp. H20]|uniref:type II toxin-antitoxin system PemK/MazF family toxin n=1 Tax=Arthrobacter sp. H20 TaxID=1267981 RepID=UPI00047ECA77|nr:type II toxin-antitoxin system PemK/MazF family toxin [Arthrobacter sp. H20]
MQFDASSLLRLARSAVRALQPAQRRSGAGHREASYPGDFTGTPRISYTPRADDVPDAGEIVWAWVPYEEDHRRGKDRPVLLIGKHRGRLLGLMLTSRNRVGSQATDPSFIDIGSGDWDRQGRPSEVWLDRIIQLAPADVRRIGAVLPRAQFERVAARLN